MLTCAAPWRGREATKLSEMGRGRRTDAVSSHRRDLLRRFRRATSIEPEGRTVGAQGWGLGGQSFVGTEFQFGGDEKFWKLHSDTSTSKPHV